MRIEVTHEDIKDGKPLDCGYCPVALAMRRRGFEDVRVGSGGISFRAAIGEGRTLVQTKPSVHKFIRLFDDADSEDERMALDPFSFELGDVIC